MAATSKKQLLQISQKEFDKLEKLIVPISSTQAMLKDADDTSVKDVIAHRAHWIDLFLGWHADGKAGKTVHFPAEGYKWNDLKRYNSELRAAQKDMTWEQACAEFCEKHEQLLSFVDTCTDEALYGHPMKGANNNWTTGRWAEAAGPSHYRSAAKYVRSRLKFF